MKVYIKVYKCLRKTSYIYSNFVCSFSVEERWTRGPFVSEEYCLLTGLVPNTDYIFRVSCHNKYGSSPYSWASLPVTTGSVGELINSSVMY